MNDSDKQDYEDATAESDVEAFSEYDGPVEEGVSEEDTMADEDLDFSADEEFLEEDWEAYDDEFSEEGVDASPVKKKKSKTDKLIIGGGAVVGVLVLLFMMGGGSNPPAPQQTTTVTSSNASADHQLSSVKKQAMDQIQAPTNQRDVIYGNTNGETNIEAEKTPSGFLNDPDALDDMGEDIDKAFEEAGFYYEEIEDEGEGDGAALPDSFSGDDDFYETGILQEDQSLPMPTPIRQVDMAPGSKEDTKGMVPDLDFKTEMDQAEEISRSPAKSLRNSQGRVTSAPLPKAQDIMIPTVTEPESNIPSGKTSNRLTQEDLAGIEALNKKLDLISNRLDSMESSVSALEDNMVHRTDMPDISSIEAAVNSLENKVSKLSWQQKEIAEAQQEKALSYKESPSVSRSSRQENPTPPVPVKKEVPDKKSSLSTPSTAHNTAESVLWELKSIRPGTAWISRQGENDMKTVQVGDSLPGIGTITAIDYMDGHWVVKGTQNSIVQ